MGLEQDAAFSSSLSQHGSGPIPIRRRGFSAALDTSASRTAICVVNSRDGSVVFEVSVATDPAIIFGALAPFLPRLDRIGHEAGSVAPWLQATATRRHRRH
jgi:hypothetical protein